MPLQPQLVPIVLDKGMTQKEDDKTLPAGVLARLENAYRLKGNKIQKRNGLTSLPSAISGGGNISSAFGMATFGDELLQLSNNRAYSFSPSANQWYSKGPLSFGQASTKPLIRNTQQQSLPDANYNPNTGLVTMAWEDTAGGVWGQVYDFESGSVLVPPTQLDASGIRPKVVSIGPDAFIYYVVSSNLYCRKYTPKLSVTFGSAVSLANDVAASGLYDVGIVSRNMVAAWANTADHVKLSYVTSVPALGGAGSGLPTTVTINEKALGAISVSVQPGIQIFLSWYTHSTTNLRVTARKTVDFTQVFAPKTIDTGFVNDLYNLTFVSVSTGSMRYIYEVPLSNSYDTYLVTGTIANDGTLSGSTVLRRSVGLFSKAFTYAGHTYVLATFDSSFQASYFLLRDDGLVVTKSLYGIGGGLTAKTGSLREVSILTSGQFFLPILEKTKVVTDTTTTYTRKGVTALTIDLSATSIPQTFQIGKNLVLLGGLVQAYDGTSFTELGFNVFPEGLVLSSQATSGGHMSDGTYQVYAVYEWTDAQGQIHRSAPSAPLTVVINGGGSTQKYVVTCPTLRLTAKHGSRTAPVIAFYRTQNGLTVPYRTSSQSIASGTNGIILNDETADTVSYTDLLADATILTNEILYTTGGTLQNIAPSSCSAGVIYKRRLFLNTTDDSGVTVYSKTDGLSFNPGLTQACDSTAQEDVLALAVMDGNLLLSHGEDFALTSGDPNNDQGQGGTLPVAQRLATSSGCPFPTSMAVTKDGLIFKSKKGYRRLRRNFTDEPFGAPVMDEAIRDCVGVFNLPTFEEVRFITSGNALSYNEFFNQWSVFTNYSAKHSVIWQDKLAVVSTLGIVRVEDSITQTDDGSFVQMLVEFGWIAPGGIQGFQRVWRLLVLGDYLSPHQLRISVATNFEPAWKEVRYFNPALAINQTTYGSATPYGNETYGGGTNAIAPLDSVYQARMHLTYQKCESMKIQLADVQTGAPGASLNLNAITLELGIKKGTFKAANAKSVAG